MWSYGSVRPRDVRADELAREYRMILVLDAEPPAEDGVGKLATSPAAKMSSRSPTRPRSSTTMPLSTGRPASSARLVFRHDPEPGDDGVGLHREP